MPMCTRARSPTLLARNVSVLVLADIGKSPAPITIAVAKFVSNGGVLLRFAGERMTANVDDLVPVKLRVGGRYLGGALAWAAPQHLAPFPDASPFRGLAIPPEVTVSRQVLAEPSVELGDRTWARLADGTPLVTAAPRGKGWIVLFHITASPAWSSLPLSGLYVDMLRRLLRCRRRRTPCEMADAATSLPPSRRWTASATRRAARRSRCPSAAPISRKIVPSPAHPPGLYGAQGAEMRAQRARARRPCCADRRSARHAAPMRGTTRWRSKPPLLALAHRCCSARLR